MYLNSIFASLSQSERLALIARCEVRSYRRNEKVLTASDQAEFFYYVADGLLQIVAQGANGSRPFSVTTEFLKRGDFFLNSSFHDLGNEVMQTLVAVLPTAVWLLDASELRNLCNSHPKVVLGMLEHCTKRANMISDHLASISSLSAEELVSRVIEKLTIFAPASGSYDKRISQSVIASYTGLSRGVVNKTIRKLKDRSAFCHDENSANSILEGAPQNSTKP